MNWFGFAIFALLAATDFSSNSAWCLPFAIVAGMNLHQAVIDTRWYRGAAAKEGNKS